MRNSGQRDLLKPTLVFNGACLALVTFMALFVGASLWFSSLFAVVMLVVANFLWVVTFMILSCGVLFKAGVLRALCGVLNHVFKRRNVPPKIETRTPELEQKLARAMRWSSFSLVTVPLVGLLGVIALDVIIIQSVSILYLMCISQCCVGLIGWILALRETIAPLPLGIGDGFDV